jgi:acyl-[acyl-carrier-protein]-phospholipid O-acyltransferase/long-chain-fatty-acid--[acyl-carrier-protein] ligase
MSAPPHDPPPEQSAADPGFYDSLPPLGRDRSYWGMAATQFLGAFNDNLFKQLMLLLATPVAVAAAVAGADQSPDRQGEAMIVFCSGFLLFSGIAGFVSDRNSKQFVIVCSKVAEIGVMLAGLVGFYFYDSIGFPGMLVVLFFMGLQSTFFGPAKYGILPETIRSHDLPRANGIFLMLTFLAIIFGTAVAGILKDVLEESGMPIWPASLVCVVIAVAGTLTSLMVRRVAPVDPSLKLEWQSIGVPREIVELLKTDRELLLALVVASMFWMLGGIAITTVNALGITQLGLSDTKASLLAAMIGLGIAVGCVLGGYLSRGTISARVVTVGAWGIVICLTLMCLPGGPKAHLLQFAGSIPVLILLGIFTGMFVVPVQVILQLRPPRGEKGRMIAVQNLTTNFGIILGAVVFKLCIAMLAQVDGPPSAIFAITAAIMLPVALFYRPKEMQLD